MSQAKQLTAQVETISGSNLPRNLAGTFQQVEEGEARYGAERAGSPTVALVTDRDLS